MDLTKTPGASVKVTLPSVNVAALCSAPCRVISIEFVIDVGVVELLPALLKIRTT